MSGIVLQASVLREGQQVPQEALVKLLTSSEGLRTQAALIAAGHASAWPAVARIGRQAISGLLAVDLRELLAAAWNKYRTLPQYADPDKTPTGKPAYVELVEHTATAKLHPALEVYIQGSKVAAFEFTLEIRVTLRGFCLRIESGRITVIESGTVTGSFKLLAGDAELHEGTFTELTLPGRITLERGIPIAA